jgi:hypothetical protein
MSGRWCSTFVPAASGKAFDRHVPLGTSGPAGLESLLPGCERPFMSMVTTLNDCARLISDSKRPDELREALLVTCHELGFGYFALTQHPNVELSADRCMRLHNYAAEWQACYDRRNLGRADPVHRASHIWACGFPWSDLHSMIPFTDRDQAMLDEAGIFDRWIGCDKSNWEIGGILSLQEDTIKKHVRRLFAHYGVYKRTSLPLHALREGVLCLTDLFPESQSSFVE